MQVYSRRRHRERERDRERQILILAGNCPVLIVCDAWPTLQQLQPAIDLCSNWQTRGVYSVHCLYGW